MARPLFPRSDRAVRFDLYRFCGPDCMSDPESRVPDEDPAARYLSVVARPLSSISAFT
jgi:hypothetical protein